MNTIYTSGKYLETTQTWHSEDSSWKAEQIIKLIEKNNLCPKTVAEIGCGAGSILTTLSQTKLLNSTRFRGYDISPQAIDLASKFRSERVWFFKIV